MIKQLYNSDTDIVLKKLNKKDVHHSTAKALVKAYGFDTSIIEFYSDRKLKVIIHFMNTLATVVALKKLNRCEKQEIVDFIVMRANKVFSNIDLNFDSSYKSTIGNSYNKKYKMYNGYDMPVERNNLNKTYKVLKEIFFLNKDEEFFKQWYTDMSHRVRHDTATIYYYEDSTLTVTSSENNLLVVDQLASLPKARGKGNIKLLLNQAIKDYNLNTVALNSESSESDSFYEHLGFKKTGTWKLYIKD